ncbi:MAG: alcohol dehydrogenase catalytic domain-containing protein, partial [Actinomycetes bacterium]
MTDVRAMLVGKVNDVWTRRIETISSDSLGEGEVLIAVEYSCINYKDGLSTTEKGKVARIDPLIPGVDLAGTVVESSDASISVGSKVIAHGNDIGVAHNGGFATMARVPGKWVIS